MPFVVETGAGLSTANSFASVAAADAYVAERGVTGWAGLLTADKQAALVKATDYLEASYRASWDGFRVSGTQALSWPRSDVIVDEFPVPANIVPLVVVNACIEMALRAVAGTTLIEDQGQLVIRERVDVIETEYAPFSDPSVKYPFVSRMLAPYLLSSSGSGFAQVRFRRT
jgi:hypothetical protein